MSNNTLEGIRGGKEGGVETLREEKLSNTARDQLKILEEYHNFSSGQLTIFSTDKQGTLWSLRVTKPTSVLSIDINKKAHNRENTPEIYELRAEDETQATFRRSGSVFGSVTGKYSGEVDIDFFNEAVEGLLGSAIKTSGLSDIVRSA